MAGWPGRIGASKGARARLAASRAARAPRAVCVPNLQGALFCFKPRIVGGHTLRVLKLVKLYPVSFVSRVCDQFCLCNFVECDQPLLTFGRAVVYRKKPPI